VIAAAPSWHSTIAACAVILSVAAPLFVLCLRDLMDRTAGERGQRTSQPLPLIIFGGVPVAVSTAVLFARVAHRDNALEWHEVVVLCAGSGAMLLLITVDLIRSGRRDRAAARQRTGATP
jgi:hypothetical protein